jgi:hypothetical protein
MALHTDKGNLSCLLHRKKPRRLAFRARLTAAFIATTLAMNAAFALPAKSVVVLSLQ